MIQDWVNWAVEALMSELLINLAVMNKQLIEHDFSMDHQWWNNINFGDLSDCLSPLN